MTIAAVAPKAPTAAEVVLSQARQANAGIANVSDATVAKFIQTLAADGPSKSDVEQIAALRKDGVMSAAAQESLANAQKTTSEGAYNALVDAIKADGVITGEEQGQVREFLRDPRVQVKTNALTFAAHAADFNMKKAIDRAPAQAKEVSDAAGSLGALKRGEDTLKFVEDANRAMDEGNAKLQVLMQQAESLKRLNQSFSPSKQAAFKPQYDAAMKQMNNAMDSYRTARQALTEQLVQLTLETGGSKPAGA